ncbi:hypothetical protein QBC35DRAFT_550016 [Podospora australis]|uniref:Uncharacterized protein n=1 Tax=Podospora australis TaxID=1536484 RepID=A0AAN6WV95_9PEZI|nr:hypothetical protein QBC35DRAFT_550016 [Podospora australis]
MDHRRGERLTIRILILGAEGVGKKSLESHFTATRYPTTISRQHLGLSPPPSPTLSLQTTLFNSGTTSSRSRSASSTAANLGSVLESDHGDVTPNEKPLPPLPSSSSGRPQSFLVETTTLSSADLLNSRELANHDAVLFVYDITNRTSFAAISTLYHPAVIASQKKSTTGTVCTMTSSIFRTKFHLHNASSTSCCEDWKPVMAIIGNNSDLDGDASSFLNDYDSDYASNYDSYDSESDDDSILQAKEAISILHR